MTATTRELRSSIGQRVAIDRRVAIIAAAAVVVTVAAVAILTGAIDALGASVRAGSWTPSSAITIAGLAVAAWFAVCVTFLGEGYLAVLWLVGAFVPGLAAALTVLAYLLLPADAGRTDALFLGMVGAAGIWAVAAVPLRGLATAPRAQSRGYSSLLQRAAQLRVRLEGLEMVRDIEGPDPASHERDRGGRRGGRGAGVPVMATAAADAGSEPAIAGGGGPDGDPTADDRTAASSVPGQGRAGSAALAAAAAPSAQGATVVTIPRAAARGSAHEVGEAAAPRDRGRDALVTEYVALAEARRELDLAERDLTESATRGALRWVTGAGYITVSRALHRAEEALVEVEPDDGLIADALHDDLSICGSTIQNAPALRSLIREAVCSISPAACQRLFPEIRPIPSPAHDAPTLRPAEARATLREVRHVVNDVRDGSRDGLIRARSRVLWAVIFAAAATYLLLGLAVIERVETKHIVAAAAFYLVGAIVGLFNRLRIEGASSAGIEDFGLFQARLIHTPVVSGLAAVAGVFLVAAAPSFLAPVGGAAGSAAGSVAGTTISLSTVFDLATNQPGLIVAAVFGLAPGALTRSLQDEVSVLERTLRKSEPGASSDPAVPPA